MCQIVRRHFESRGAGWTVLAFSPTIFLCNNLPGLLLTMVRHPTVLPVFLESTLAGCGGRLAVVCRWRQCQGESEVKGCREVSQNGEANVTRLPVKGALGVAMRCSPLGDLVNFGALKWNL